jgi:hypothetical protein
MNAVQPLATVTKALRPIAPWHWPEVSRRLAVAHGWIPPMLMIAALGSAYGMHELWELVLGPQLAFPLQGLTWLTWFAVGLIATGTVAKRGAGNILRFGPWGLTRPRWWFEVARLVFLVTLIDLLVFLLAMSVWPNAMRGPMAVAADLIYGSLRPLFVSWVVVASVGYTLAWLRWLPLRGKAFDCVHYFYVMVVSIVLATSGVLLFEAQRPWFVRVFATTIGAAGAVLFVFGFISIVRRWERYDRAVAERERTDSHPVNGRAS